MHVLRKMSEKTTDSIQGLRTDLVSSLDEKRQFLFIWSISGPGMLLRPLHCFDLSSLSYILCDAQK